MKYHLSKSRYCAALQCPKIIWLKENMPDVIDQSAVNESVMETGLEVGDLAMGLFGDYTEVPFGNLGVMIEQTKKLIDDGTKIIAEASFGIDNLFCSVDILKNMGNMAVELYEVKSSSSVHDIYYHDTAFQCYVLSRLGYKVERCAVVHIDSTYKRNGELDIHKLFKVEDITGAVQSLQEDVSNNIENIRKYMEQVDEPCEKIGKQCFSPYSCPFLGYCTKDLPTPNVFDIAGARTSKKLKCFDKGIVSFEALVENGELNQAQRLQVEHELATLEPHIEVDNIKDFMKDLYYPLYFLDFESFQPAIPLFDKSHPYQQIVFQYSLHYIETEGGELKHKEFLAYPGEDPRRALAEQLCKDIPDNACVTAYNMGFEKGCIYELSLIYSDLKEKLLNIHDHIYDLMIPFQKKWYYCRDMQGSYSIKYVLPALFPDDPTLDYHNLEGVHNGSEASEAFAKMATMTEDESEATRKHLLKYCGLDTYAMVKVWEKLKNLCNNN